ncbi:MAG: PQQ-dependent sugar dehydrogenase [Gaiellaceae bacterium]
MRRAFLGVLLVTIVLAAAGGANAAINKQLVANFNTPIQVDAPPWVAGSTLYVAEKPGRVIRYRDGRRWTVLNISGMVSNGGEQGLLSITFHPTMRYLYVYYTNTAGDSVIARYTLDKLGLRAQLATRKVLLRVGQPYENHNGGTLRFGPDGKLYFGFGDGGSGCDPEERAQNPGTLLGKLVRRFDGRWKVVGYGLRNPWRWSFDRANGDIYIGDVGQSAREEINYLPAAKVNRPSENYGWDKWEGDLQDTCPTDGLKGTGELIAPAWAYPRSTGFTVIGGFVYRGTQMPGQVGKYFVGDLNGEVRRADAVTLANRSVAANVSGLVSFGENSRGELFAVSIGGSVYKIVDN